MAAKRDRKEKREQVAREKQEALAAASSVQGRMAAAKERRKAKRAAKKAAAEAGPSVGALERAAQRDRQMKQAIQKSLLKALPPEERPKKEKKVYEETPKTYIDRDVYLADEQKRRDEIRAERAAKRAQKDAAREAKRQALLAKNARDEARRQRSLHIEDEDLEKYLLERGWTKVTDASTFVTFKGNTYRGSVGEGQVPSVWSKPNWETGEGDCVRTLRKAYKIQYALDHQTTENED